jgi:hypothetical protein
MIRNPSPLDRLHGRRAIGDKEYSALKRYYHQWHCAGLQSAVGSADLNRLFASDLGSMSVKKQIYHRKQYRTARCLIGHRPGIEVDNVVCCEWSLEIGGAMELDTLRPTGRGRQRSKYCAMLGIGWRHFGEWVDKRATDFMPNGIFVNAN